MPKRSLLSKDWVLEVDTSNNATPSWAPVIGLTSFSETIDSNMEDDADFSSDGWGSSVATQRTWSLECEGRRKADLSGGTFVPDPGQETVRLAGRKLGFDANLHIRYYRKDGSPDAYEGYVSVDYGGGGGGVTGLEPFNFTLNGQGKPTSITNPSTVAAGPVISSVNPATGPAAGGTLITITGTGFTGATAVTFGGTAASSFRVISDTYISAVTPAKTAGAQPVVVTTPAGTSAPVTYTYS